MPPRRFRAPAADGGVLADPGFDAVPGLVDENRRRLDRADVTVGGLPLRELRALARREVLELAGGRRQPAVPALAGEQPADAGRPPDAPLLVAGHQPELSHPGVWVKHFALNGLARKLGGVPLNLVVDNDTLKSTSLRFPVFRDRDPASVHLEPVAFDRFEAETPYEDRGVIDAPCFRSFPERAAPLWRNWGYEPLLASVWASGGRQPPEGGALKIGEAFTQMRRDREREWGCVNAELPVSRLAQTDAFHRFARHVLGDLPRFRDVYNAAIRTYRAANGIRSLNHPAPELAPDEAPFWVRTTDGRRKRATPASGHYSLRPRALTLTLFARVCLGDFFIHGIGGGKYDEVTDAIIRDYFGVEPPAYQVLSATLHLPLPRFPAAAADVERAEQHVRDLNWNPQRHLPAEVAGRPDVRPLLAEKAALTANEPPRDNRPARRDWFRRLHALTERLRPLVADRIAAAEADLARARTEAHANDILLRRDFAWVLYPEAALQPFLQQFLTV